jgi:hypothetical protein
MREQFFDINGNPVVKPHREPEWCLLMDLLRDLGLCVEVGNLSLAEWRTKQIAYIVLDAESEGII